MNVMLGEPHSWSWRCNGMFPALPGIESRFSVRLTCSLSTVYTELPNSTPVSVSYTKSSYLQLLPYNWRHSESCRVCVCNWPLFSKGSIYVTVSWEVCILNRFKNTCTHITTATTKMFKIGQRVLNTRVFFAVSICVKTISKFYVTFSRNI
jgi:hypothetical protein